MRNGFSDFIAPFHPKTNGNPVKDWRSVKEECRPVHITSESGIIRKLLEYKEASLCLTSDFLVDIRIYE